MCGRLFSFVQGSAEVAQAAVLHRLGPVHLTNYVRISKPGDWNGPVLMRLHHLVGGSTGPRYSLSHFYEQDKN